MPQKFEAVPLPAVIFLCSVILLLIALALLYFFLKKHECCKMEGKADEEEELIDGGDPSLKGASTNGQTNTNAENSSTTNNGPASGGKAGTINTQTGEAGSSSQQAGGGGGGGGGATGGGAGASGGGGGTAVDSAGNNNIQADPSGDGTDVAGKSNGISSASGNGMQGQSAKSMSNSNDINAQGEDMSIIVDEPVQGVDFIESEETEPLAIAGKVLVQFTYMPAANKVNLTLIRIGDMPPVERGGSETVQAHLCVLPMRKQRFRTKAVPVSKGVFNETFQFIHMTKDLVETCAIRLRIYGTQRFSKRLIGEVKMPLSKLDLTSPLADEQIWKNLSPKGLVDDCEPSYNLCELSSLASYGESSSRPELLVNLHFKDLTQRLTVEVIRGANFKREYMMLSPDSFIKVKAISGKGKKIGKSKTTVRRNSSDPDYNETFVYPMSQEDLKDATILFTVYSVAGKRSKKKTIIGWFAFGRNTSGAGETNHWKEMVQNPDTDVCHWRQLQGSG